MRIRDWSPVASWLGFVGMLSACGGGGSGGASPDQGAAGSGGWTIRSFGTAGVTQDAEPEPVPEPFTHDFPALMTQSVRWSSIDVGVTGARQVRGVGDASAVGIDDYGRALTGSLDPSQIYVELDLELTNRGVEEGVLEHRGTWDLVLAGGQRIMPSDWLDVRVLPGDTASAQLHYAVDAEVDLTGATLVLNGEDRTSAEPEHIPLDVPYVQQYPRRIASMVGQQVAYKVDNDHATVAIDEAAYDVNYERKHRAPQGKRLVWLKLAFTSNDPRGGFYSADEVRLVVDGRAQTSVDHGFEVIDAGETMVFPLAFVVDAATATFEIVFPDGTPEGKRFLVDVADTVLARDIP